MKSQDNDGDPIIIEHGNDEGDDNVQVINDEELARQLQVCVQASGSLSASVLTMSFGWPKDAALAVVHVVILW